MSAVACRTVARVMADMKTPLTIVNVRKWFPDGISTAELLFLSKWYHAYKRKSTITDRIKKGRKQNGW